MKAYLFDHYYLYEELQSTLQELENDYSSLLKVTSICKTLENRDVFACEITNYTTGGPLTKPAYYVDGNHHAGEVTGSMAALHLVVTLVQQYGKDEKITQLLDNNTVYVIPRISPDGAETYLSSFEKLRSVNRPYPFKKPASGLHPTDMDGDGVIRTMRVPTPSGVWKESSVDPRIMVKRSPSDFGGKYYNVYPEGTIVDYDGINIYPAEGKWNLDFNRNYPLGWYPEARQGGAGDYPLSNPENKAIVEFVLSHKNICSAVSYHTSGGCYIYPPGTKSEKDADKRDMKMFKEIGKMATEETGYECFNIFDGFLTDTVNFSSGAFDDWMYMAQGIPTYTAELWDLCIRAGSPDKMPKTVPLTDDEQVDRMMKCYKWIDENTDGKQIKEWTPFQHPQLGLVELGSFDFKYTWQNCPPPFLLQEVEKNTNFCLRMAQTMPRLAVDDIVSEVVSEGVYKVTATFSNHGYMPTFVSNEAKSLKVAEELVATLTVDGSFVMGEATQKVGHLEGFSGIQSRYAWDNIATSKHEPVTKALTWMIKADKGQTLTFTVGNHKSGTATKTVTL